MPSSKINQYGGNHVVATSFTSCALCDRTPCSGRLYDALPEESRTARVKLVAPQAATPDTDLVVHLAGTGDHGFERRLHLGFPLIKQVSKIPQGITMVLSAIRKAKWKVC